MEKNNNKNIIIIILVIVILIMGYFMNKIYNDKKIPSIYMADKRNLIDDVNYDLNISSDIFNLCMIDNKIMFLFRGNEDDLTNYSTYFKKKFNIKSNFQYEVTVFSKRVVDFEIGCIGQDSIGTIFLFLYEDGTIGYSNLENMLTNLNCQEEVSGLVNIVRLQRVNIWAQEDGGHESIIAIDSKNIAYNIENYIKN